MDTHGFYWAIVRSVWALCTSSLPLSVVLFGSFLTRARSDRVAVGCGPDVLARLDLNGQLLPHVMAFELRIQLADV